MTSLIKWKLYCVTEQEFKTVWSSTIPTECPTNNTHTIGEIVDQGANSRTIYEKMETTNDVFTNTKDFFFAGTLYVGEISIIRALCKVEDGTGRIRVYDRTNNQQICISDTISNTSMDIIVFPTFSNVPNAGAIWEIHLIKDTGTGKIISDSLILSF